MLKMNMQDKKSFHIFVDLGDMQRHSRVHSGDKPFLCTTCPKAFTRLTYLQAHMAQHNNTWPLVCIQCGAEFKSRPSLRQHMRKAGHRPDGKPADQTVKEENEEEEILHELIGTEASGDNVKYVYCVGGTDGEIPLSVLESIKEEVGDGQYFLSSDGDTVHFIPEGEESSGHVYTEEVQHINIVETGEVITDKQTHTVVFEGQAEGQSTGSQAVLDQSAPMAAGELMNHLLSASGEVTTEHAHFEMPSEESQRTQTQLEVSDTGGDQVILIPVMAAADNVDTVIDVSHASC